jgi:acyl dehydratase
MNPPQLHFEDLEPRQSFVSATHSLDTAQIKQFAAQFDPQPFHLGAAASSLFGGLVASGWQTAALSMRLLSTGGLIGASADLE